MLQAFRNAVTHKDFVRGSIWLTAEKALLALKGVVLLIAFANYLDPQIYGGYQYLLSLLGLLSIFSVPSMGTALVRAVANKRYGTFPRALRVMTRWSLLGSISLLGVALYQAWAGDSTLLIPLVGLAVIFPGYGIMTTWRYYYLGKQNYYQLAKTSLIIEAITLVTTLLAILYLNPLWSIVVASVGITLLLSLVVLRPIIHATKDAESSEDDIHYGQQLTLSYAVTTASGFIDKLLIGQYLGLVDVAIYSVALTIPEQLRAMLSIFNALLLPRFSKNDDGRTYRTILLMGIALLTIAVALFAFLYYWIAPPIFSWLLPAYENSLGYSRALTAGLIFIPLQVLDSFFRGQRAEKVVLKITVITSIAGLILSLVLIPQFGIWGAVYAKIATFAITGGALLWAFLKSR